MTEEEIDNEILILKENVIDYRNSGNYNKAMASAEELRDLIGQRIRMGNDNPDYARILDMIAELYDSMGRYSEAEPLYLQAKEIRRKSLGEDHPDYATSLDNQASLYYSTGRYSEAEPLYFQAKEIHRKSLGENHPDYATSLDNLAWLYYSMGRYNEALPLYLQSKGIRRKSLGEDHPDYATSLDNLGLLYYSMGRYSEAEPLYLQAAEIRRKSLGEDHPDYATSQDNLAELYRSMGRDSGAEPLRPQATEIRRNSLGEDHPDYAKSPNNLVDSQEVVELHCAQSNSAAFLSYLPAIQNLVPDDLTGRYINRADSLYRQPKENIMISIMALFVIINAVPLIRLFLYWITYSMGYFFRKSLGKDHLDYAASLNNRALSYYSRGRYSEAEPLFRQATEIRRNSLGEDHPDYAQSLNNLAALYDSMGRYDEAEPLYYQATKIRRNSLGEDHPDYAQSLNNLAGLYYSMGRYSEAEPLLRQATEISRKSLGEDHLDYAQSLNNLAELYRSMGRYIEAETLFRQAAEIRRKVLGKDPLERIILYPRLIHPEKLKVNWESDIIVQLQTEASEQDIDAVFIEYSDLQNQLPRIEMALMAPDFAVNGEGTKILNVTNDEDSKVANFSITPLSPGENQIRVDFYQSGRRIGMIRENVNVEVA